jgi:hypothetical protein
MIVNVNSCEDPLSLHRTNVRFQQEIVAGSQAEVFLAALKLRKSTVDFSAGPSLIRWTFSRRKCRI